MIELVNQMTAYQTTVFITNSVKCKNPHNFFFKKILSHSPTVTIDISDTNNLTNTSLIMPIFKNPRKSSNFIIYAEETDQYLNKMCQIIDLLANMSPILMRPKCLLIFWNENLEPEKEIYKILRYAWDKKFLDFTVMIKNVSNLINLVYYNPFTQTYKWKILRNTSKIFPNKIKNVNKYPLVMPGFSWAPFVIIKKNDDEIPDARGIDYDYIKMMAVKFNFKPEFKIIKYNNDSVLMDIIQMGLATNDLTMTTMIHPIRQLSYGKKCIIGKFIGQSKMVTVVPIIKEIKFNFTLDILLYILSFPILIFAFVFIKNLLRFGTENWKVFNIYKIFLGISVDSPEKSIERQFFLLLTVTSIVYTDIIFSKLAEINLSIEEKEYGTVEDLVNSGMKIKALLKANEHDDPDVQKLLSHAEPVNNVINCTNELIKTRSLICISLFNAAKYMLRRNIDENGEPIMKFVQPSFRYQFTAFGYEKASPFAEKFDQVIQQIIESGIFIDRRLQMFESKVIHPSEKQLYSVGEDVSLTYQLIAVSLFGNFCGTAVFLYEIGRWFWVKLIHRMEEGSFS